MRGQGGRTCSVAVLSLALLLSSCHRGGSSTSTVEAEAGVNDPSLVTLASPSVFVVGQTGLEARSGPWPDGAESAPKAGGRIGAVSARAGGAAGPASLLVAIDGWGVVFIEPTSDGAKARLRIVALPGWTGLRVGGAWPFEAGFLIQTYRDPFAEPTAASAASSAAASADHATAGPSQSGLCLAQSTGKVGSVSGLSLPWLAEKAAQDLEPFALLPDPRGAGSWLLQLRSAKASPVRSEFVALPDLRSPSPLPLSRSAFEAALRPKSLAQAPEAFRRALAALSPDAPDSAFVLHSGSAGFREWYSFGDDPSSSRELVAWSDSTVGSLVLSPDGAGSLAGPGTAEALQFRLSGLPEGAFCTGCCLVPLPDRRLLVLASWEGLDAQGEAISGIALLPLHEAI